MFFAAGGQGAAGGKMRVSRREVTHWWGAVGKILGLWLGGVSWDLAGWRILGLWLGGGSKLPVRASPIRMVLSDQALHVITAPLQPHNSPTTAPILGISLPPSLYSRSLN